jgi:hypothetical protein
MQLETIMQILYANKLTDVIVLATQIDNNIVSPTDKHEGDMIDIRVSKSELASLGYKPKDESTREHWFTVPVQIVSVNKYALTEKYLVYVNGKPKWVTEEENKYSSAEAIVVEETAGAYVEQTQ